MSDVMMKLGGFAFTVATAAYRSLQRSTQWRWAAQERIGQHDALQFVGRGTDTISLNGTIVPSYRGAGGGQVDNLRSQGNQEIPLLLVAGTGKVLGFWVVEEVTETQDIHYKDGMPRRQQFSIRLRYYGDNV